MRCFVSLVDYHRPASSFLLKRGLEAERQMAYLLKSYFLDDDRVYIINGLRLKAADDIYFQMDHLLLHPRGAFIIESKSVSTKVKINREGEWMRLVEGHWRGMPSPVHQVERQALLFRKVLEDRKEVLRDSIKILGLKKQFGFRNMPIETIVAISSHGLIGGYRRNRMGSVVLKADAVPGFIKRRMDEMYPSTLVEKLNDTGWLISHEELERVVAYLRISHEPLEKEPARVSEEKVGYAGDKPESTDGSQVVNLEGKGESRGRSGASRRYFCARCKKDISAREARYCFDRKETFGGRAYCYDCQRIVKGS